MDAHENSIGGSQVYICPVAIYQTPREFDPAGNSRSVFHRQPNGFQFLATKGFETGRGGSEIRAAASDHMAFDAF